MFARALSIVALLSFVAGCSAKESSRPPGVGDCVGEGCRPSAGGGTSPPQEAGAPTEDAAADGGLVEVTGTIETTADQGFALTAPYGAPVVVRAEGAASGIIDTDGGVVSSFTLGGVASGLNWFSVGDVNPGGSMLPTLQPVDVDGTTPVRLVGVDAATFSTTLFQMSPPQTQAAGRGQLILFFVKGSGAATLPAADVSLKAWVSAEAVAYDDGADYAIFATPDQGKTGAAGTALLVNVPAVPYPGGLVTLRFDAGSGEQAIAVKVAADYVTRAVIGID